jgi:hypothetical protein
MVSPANCLQEKFLEDLTEQLFPPRQHSEVQKLCFQLRFHPSNWNNVEHTQIAVQISKQLNGGFSESSINPTVGDVVKKIKDKFEAQMRADGVEVEKLNPGRGKPKESPWQIVYKWLWETEFPRCGWQLSKEIAIYADEQMRMQPLVAGEDCRDLDLSDIPDVGERTIQKGKEYRLQLNLQQSGYLLLINQGVSGRKYGICPSWRYNPDGQLLSSILMAVPNEKGLAKFLRYNAVGDEYFLAIVTEKPLKLSWLRSDSKPNDIAIDEGRLDEIFKQVGQQQNCQVFYKTFEVID